jgi:hypothetical protein
MTMSAAPESAKAIGHQRFERHERSGLTTIETSTAVESTSRCCDSVMLTLTPRIDSNLVYVAKHAGQIAQASSGRMSDHPLL